MIKGDTYSRLAEDLASDLGVRLVQHLGQGGFGDAFLTDGYFVIKITSDRMEYKFASMLEGLRNRYVADVYHVCQVDGAYGIAMEFLDQDGVDQAFKEASEITSEIGGWMKAEQYDLSAHASHNMNAVQLIEDICGAIHELKFYGLCPQDIRPENIGRKREGQFALFDQRDYGLSEHGYTMPGEYQIFEAGGLSLPA